MRIAFMLAAWLCAGAAQANALADQLDEAWRLHPEARALDARSRSLKASGIQAESLLAAPPAIAVSYRGDQLTADRGQREFEAELDLPVWLPGQRTASREVLAAELAVVEAARLALRLRLLGELRERNGALRRAQAELDLTGVRLDEARALERDVERRYKAGDLARTDFLASRMETLALMRELSARERLRNQARSELATLSGSERAAPAEALATAEPTHPDVSLRLAELVAAREKFRLARLERRATPELSLFGRRERDDRASDYADSLGLRLKLPLATEARNAPRVADALGAAEMADAHWRYAQRLTAAAVLQAEAVLDSARQGLELAKQRAEVSAENHRHLRRAFDYGERDLATLLRAKALADAARLEAVLAEGEMETAIARLNQARGVLP
jgi:cobalt-zinc-cadmium efflux system outer membrane protein